MQLPHPSPELTSTRVLVRFALRMAVLVGFASLGGIGFGRSLAALLWMTIILSVVIGAMRQERPFDTTLNHWDEAAAYTALFCLIHVIDHLGFNELTPA
jgi:hypothetical protein